MILVIPVALKEIDRAIEMLGWIDELGGCRSHSLVLVLAYPVSTEEAKALSELAASSFSSVTVIRQATSCEDPWPKNANAMFKCAAEYMQRLSGRTQFLWMELDAVPTRCGWLDILEDEYKSVGKPVMGTMYSKPFRHINGVAIYPNSINSFNPWMLGATDKPFDLTSPTSTLRVAHVTNKIVRSLFDPATNTPHTFQDTESLSVIPSECVLFHGCKDGTLIDQLRKDYKHSGTTATTLATAKKAEGLKLAIVGLIKFPCADMLKLLRSMRDLFEVFPDWQGFFSVASENLSDVGILSRWARNNGYTVNFITDPRVLPTGRYARMATVRNRYLNLIERSGYNPDYVLSIDLDMAGFSDWSGLCDLLDDKSWGAAAVLGLKPRSELSNFHPSCELRYKGETYCYYDLLALETVDRVRTIWLDKNTPNRWYWHGDTPPNTTFTNIFPLKLTDNELIDVNSAFGPACLFRWNVAREFRYNEQDGQICHYAYQEQIRKAGKRVVICPSIVALYSDPWKHVLHTESVLDKVSSAIKKVMSHATVA